ncbi:MAG TPA: (5-formylfuran-3-yl)methyl phosphate synthase [Gemmatimonadales bacterium]|nr:(5-formylfuran-3-yl)methyl phosphate synthase [Gemmatimonadales bacterium]
MRLLVSVRSASEAEAAVAGGADIVDAKEPSRGALGPVDPAVLRRIAASLPPGMPVSAALGDFRDPAMATAAIARVPRLAARMGPLYLKLGFAGLGEEGAVDRVVTAAVAAAAARGDDARVVAVAYADHEEACTVAPEVVAAVAARRCAAGALVDTWTKDGRDLLDWMPGPRLATWVGLVHEAGMLAGIAGSLGLLSLPTVLASEADLLGVRGSVCQGGRGGTVRADRVRALRRALAGAGAVHC